MKNLSMSGGAPTVENDLSPPDNNMGSGVDCFWLDDTDD